jgi:hypothetical protein
VSKERFADRRVVFLGSMTAALATVVGVLVGAPASYAANPQCTGGQSYSAGYTRGDVVSAGHSVSVHIREDFYPITVGRLGSIRGRILLQNGAGTGFQVGLRDLGPGSSGLQAYVEYNGGNNPGDIATHGAMQGSQYTFKYTNNGNGSFTLYAFNSNWGISLTKTLSGSQHFQSYDTTSHQGTSGDCNSYSFSFANNSTYTRANLNHYADPPYATTVLDSSDPTAFTGYLP